MHNFIVTELNIRPRPGSATFRFWAASEATLMQVYIYNVVLLAYRKLTETDGLTGCTGCTMCF